jgi:hypothetical protein
MESVRLDCRAIPHALRRHGSRGLPAVWGQTLARLSTAAFRLSGAQASLSGRLSLSQTSRAEALQPFQPSREQITAWAQNQSGPLAELAHMSWPVLAEHLARCFAPSLDMPPLPAQPVILVPSRLGPGDVRRSDSAPALAIDGFWRRLDCAQPRSRRRRPRAWRKSHAALEAALGDGGNKPPFAIVAIARPEAARMTLEPIALWGETQTLLDFPQKVSQQADVVSRIMAGLRRTVSQLAPPPPADVSVRQTSALLQAGVDALIGFAEAGLNDSARDRLLPPLAKTYQLAALAPLAQLFARIIAGHEGDTASAALAAAQGLFTVQGFTSRLQVW